MKKLRVVLLERAHDHSESLLLQVKMGGHQVQVCFSPDDCLKTVEREKPNALLLNAGLAMERVYELGHHLRQLNHKIPLVLRVTQPGDYVDCELAMQSGIRFHLSKPVNASILQRILQAGNDR